MKRLPVHQQQALHIRDISEARQMPADLERLERLMANQGYSLPDQELGLERLFQGRYIEERKFEDEDGVQTGYVLTPRAEELLQEPFYY